MNPDRHQAIQYLRAPANGLWRWAEDGAVLVWRDGSTIAFREEVVEIIKWLAPNGLPSFGAVVLLLAACRGRVPAVSDVFTASNAPLPPAMGGDAVLLTTARKQLHAQLEAALAQLAKVSRLPGELNSGIKAKCVLAEAVFEPAKVERYVEAAAVLRGWREPMSDAELIDGEPPPAGGARFRQIHMLAEGLKPHSPESLSLRLRTGLDALPKDPEVNLPAAERARRLIAELSRDRDYGAVARAARELMAAVWLPRRLVEREPLATGGVADITNRGPLDRLLISELAHDDLTLAVRIALNEALYLHREPPMREPPRTLALLLDSGVRLWGVPRVLATAVALALIARDKQHCEILTWRAQGKQVQPTDLLSRNGLAQHLGVLEPHAHPGESMPAFAAVAPDGGQGQSVLITHRDALTDPELRRALAENPGAPGFVATVDRDGRFELHQLPLAHRSPLCTADLNLATVFDESTGTTTVKIEVDPNLPAIFGVSPFPFLLPVSGKVDFWVKAADGFVYAVLNDRRLVRFRDARSGALVLASDLPGGKTIWMDCNGTELHFVKVGASARPARLFSLSLPDGRLRVTDLTIGPEVLSAHRYGDALVVIRTHDVRAYSLSDGRLLGQAVNPHRVWAGGRYFRGTSHFYFAAWDGERITFEPVSILSNLLVSSVSAIFDRLAMAGPWLLCLNGSVISTDTGEVLKLPKQAGARLDFSRPRISRDGHQLLVENMTPRSPTTAQGCVFDLRGAPTACHKHLSGLSLDSHPDLPSWNLHRVIESVALYEKGIAWCGRKNRWRRLELDGSGRIRIVPHPLNSIGGLSGRAFQEPRRKTPYGCTLQMAQWANGTIFLDSRGLLHFKSSHPDIPEVSIVLAEGEVAGWTSDGHVCGPSFFFDGPYTSDPKHIFQCIMDFFARL